MNLYTKIGLGVGGGLLVGFGAGRYSMKNKVEALQAKQSDASDNIAAKISEQVGKAIQEEFKRLAAAHGVDVASLPKSQTA